MTFKTGSECLKHLASHPTTVASNDQVGTCRLSLCASVGCKNGRLLVISCVIFAAIADLDDFFLVFDIFLKLYRKFFLEVLLKVRSNKTRFLAYFAFF